MTTDRLTLWKINPLLPLDPLLTRRRPAALWKAGHHRPPTTFPQGLGNPAGFPQPPGHDDDERDLLPPLDSS